MFCRVENVIHPHVDCFFAEKSCYGQVYYPTIVWPVGLSSLVYYVEKSLNLNYGQAMLSNMIKPTTFPDLVPLLGGQGAGISIDKYISTI